MSDIAIQVEGLGKQYQIGRQQANYETIREAATRAMLSPFRKASRLVRGQATAASGLDETIWALRDVSFEVQHGEVLGIIGRNGAGKSTLLKILSRITEPTKGYADVYGRIGSLLEVGTGFHPELTGRENIFLNGAVLGMKRSEIAGKFDEIVAFAEVERFVDTPVKHYSSGMYLRLAFAVAAHLEPEILVIDEVLAVGDAAFQKKCLGKMDDVAKQGRTVLFVSHNMAAIRSLCSRSILLENGQKVLEGVTERVVTQYLALGSAEEDSMVPLPTVSNDAAGEGICLRFLTNASVPKAQFRIGETWRIVIEFKLFRAVTHMIAAVGLINFESVGIITYWSKPSDLESGYYCVEFECDIPLKSCDIQFAVGLSSYERTFYYVHRVGHVSISEVAITEQPFRASGGGLLLSDQKSKIMRMPK